MQDYDYTPRVAYLAIADHVDEAAFANVTPPDKRCLGKYGVLRQRGHAHPTLCSGGREGGSSRVKKTEENKQVGK